MKTADIRIWYVIAIIIIALVLFWVGAQVYAYVADDWNPTPADERSVPSPRSY